MSGLPKDRTMGTALDIVELTIGNTSDTGIAVASTATVYSESFGLPLQSSFSITIQFTGSAVDVLVELEQSNVKPATEQSSDSNYVVPLDVDGVSVGVIQDTTDTNLKIINFSPVATGFARLKLTGVDSNSANTILTKAELYYVKGR